MKNSALAYILALIFILCFEFAKNAHDKEHAFDMAFFFVGIGLICWAIEENCGKK